MMNICKLLLNIALLSFLGVTMADTGSQNSQGNQNCQGNQDQGNQSTQGWSLFGQNKENTHYQQTETLISPKNVSQLKTLWIYNTDNNSVQPIANAPFPKSSVVSTPSVDAANNIVYFADINGRLHAVNSQTGKAIWIKSIVWDYLKDTIKKAGANINNVQVFARTTPAIYKDMLIFGVRGSAEFIPNPLLSTPQNWIGLGNIDTLLTVRGTLVIAVDRFSGRLRWVTRVSNSAPLGTITTSLSVYNGVAYGGIAGFEESMFPAAIDGGIDVNKANTVYAANGTPIPGGFTCCGFVGSAFAIDVKTGKVLWNTPTIESSAPAGFNGWSGAAVWGSAPAIDPDHQLIYVGTGNLTNSAPDATSCLIAAGNNGAARNACVPDTVHDNSILALDMKTGAIQWSRKFTNLDVFGGYCIIATLGDFSLCNDPFIQQFLGNPFAFIENDGTDVDFAQSPMIVKMPYGKEVVLAGQKYGSVSSLNPDGSLNWFVRDGVGGKEGGHQWGMATDGKIIVNQNSNTDHIPVQLMGETTAAPGGYFTALSVNDGSILWQTRDPNSFTTDPLAIFHASPIGPISMANGVAYGTSAAHSLFALDVKTGTILWQKRDVVGAGFAAPAIVNGVVYWPTGYAIAAPGIDPVSPVNSSDPYTPYDNKVYAFTVNKCN